MKKRSLVAALAMLVVSAIVLTSSTYAWFATSSAATVDKFSASVTNNSGSLTVQAVNDGVPGTKKTALASTDFTSLVQYLQPVSLYIDNGVKVNKVAYDAAKFDAFSTASNKSDYLYYEYNAEYINGGEGVATVNMIPTFTADEAGKFLYGLLEVTAGGSTTYYIFDGHSGSYVPVKALSNGEVKDTNGNNIIDANDEGYSAADMAASVATVATSTASGATIQLFDAPAGETTTANIKVYVWAEGQDDNCSGIVNAASAGFNFALSVA